jgi:hypothetical protein
VLLAAVLSAAAALTKQSLLGPALAGTLWLLATRRNVSAILFAGVVGALWLGSAVVLQASTGGAFVSNVVGGNLHQPFDPLTLGFNLRELAIYQAAPALLAVISVVLSARDAGVRALLSDLVVVSWLGSLLPLLALGAIGADSNYWLQFAALSAVLTAACLWRFVATWRGVGAALVLVAGTVVAIYGVASWHLARPGFLNAGSARSFDEVVERVRAAPGTVLADPLDVLVLADRPILLEPIVYSLREQDGSWDSAPLVARLCAGEVSLVVLGYPPGEMAQRFPPSVAAAVQRLFEVTQTETVGGSQRWLLTPAPGRRC